MESPGVFIPGAPCLFSVKSDSRSVYPMAIAHSMKGDWRKAEELLKKDMEPLE